MSAWGALFCLVPSLKQSAVVSRCKPGFTVAFHTVLILCPLSLICRGVIMEPLYSHTAPDCSYGNCMFCVLRETKAYLFPPRMLHTVQLVFVPLFEMLSEFSAIYFGNRLQWSAHSTCMSWYGYSVWMKLCRYGNKHSMCCCRSAWTWFTYLFKFTWFAIAMWWSGRGALCLEGNITAKSWNEKWSFW